MDKSNSENSGSEKENEGFKESNVDQISSDHSRLVGKFQLIIILLDCFFVLSVDNLLIFPLYILIIFICQMLGFVINLMLYIMAAAHHTMRVRSRRSNIKYDRFSLLILLGYIITSVCWNIWTLRRAWPNMSEHFSFTLFQSSSLNDDDSHSHSTFNNNSSKVDYELINPNDIRESFSLWSPGYITLYIPTRTIGCLYYITYLKSAFILINAALFEDIDNISVIKSAKLKEEKEKKVRKSSFESNRSNYTGQDQDDGISIISSNNLYEKAKMRNLQLHDGYDSDEEDNYNRNNNDSLQKIRKKHNFNSSKWPH